jgi:hypothetical protein
MPTPSKPAPAAAANCAGRSGSPSQTNGENWIVSYTNRAMAEPPSSAVTVAFVVCSTTTICSPVPSTSRPTHATPAIIDRDLTAHAETMLVRVLEREGRLALLGEGVVYASCEPCPMCVGAMFWAGARRVVYGLSSGRLTDLATAPGAERVGFTITAPEIGSAAEPAMSFDGPHREHDAAVAHLGFWY